MDEHRRNLFPLLLMLALVGLGIAAWLVLPADARTRWSDPATSQSDAGGVRLNQRPLANPTDVHAAPGRGTPPPAEPEQPLPDDPPEIVRLRLRTPDGKSAGRLTLKVSSQGGEEEVTTGDDGTLVLAEQHRVGVVLSLLGENDYFSAPFSEFSKDHKLPNLVQHVLRDDQKAIIVYSMLTYDLEVQYADGVAWSGELFFSLNEYRTVQKLTLADGRATGLSVPSGVEGSASAHSYRAGYAAAATEWVGGDADPARPILITLPRDETSAMSMILIDLSGFPEGEKVVVTHHNVRTHSRTGVETRTVLGANHAPGGKVHIVGTHAAGSYSVSAMTRELGWNSGVIELKAGETRTLKPDLRECGSIAASVTNADGEVLADARLYIRAGVFPQWPSWLNDPPGSSIDGARCAVDEAGNCELFGIPPGPVEIEIAARKYESFVGTFYLAPGQRLDIGEIRLEPAKGVIQIQLSNFDAEKEYELILYQTGAYVVDEPVAFNESGWLDFQQVPLRTYTIIVRPKGGGTAKSRHIELTPTAPTARLDIDLRK